MTCPEDDPLWWLTAGREVPPRPTCPDHPRTTMQPDGKGGWVCPACRTQQAMFRGAARQERGQK